MIDFVIGDEEHISRMMRLTLDTAGYEVAEASPMRRVGEQRR
ncbi:MAG TPA: hypothetical protein VFX63_19420 [Pyrinomonadaceae bacterium]|nr:hypothetical protein [Pyrinomonadaceae bacterium]